jgi:hypothetical protein
VNSAPSNLCRAIFQYRIAADVVGGNGTIIAVSSSKLSRVEPSGVVRCRHGTVNLAGWPRLRGRARVINRVG